MKWKCEGINSERRSGKWNGNWRWNVEKEIKKSVRNFPGKVVDVIDGVARVTVGEISLE